MTAEEIRAAMIGKRLLTLYHGRVQIDWGEIVNVEFLEYSGTYRVSVSSEPFCQYLTPNDAEALCGGGIVEKRNEYNKHYKLEKLINKHTDNGLLWNYQT